jgi:hypothetical protein
MASLPPLRIFLDDERTPPKGWTLVRTVEEFTLALASADPQRLEAISIDWHLGKDVPDGNVALDRLIDLMMDEPGRWPSMDRVHFHSGDPDEAVAMARRFADFIRETIANGTAGDCMVMMDASMPWDEQD